MGVRGVGSNRNQRWDHSATKLKNKGEEKNITTLAMKTIRMGNTKVSDKKILGKRSKATIETSNQEMTQLFKRKKQ